MNKITSIYTQEDENSGVNDIDTENFSTVSHLSDIEASSTNAIPHRLVSTYESVDSVVERSEPEESQPVTGKMRIGEQLRRAREKRNLSVQHIADRLYLSPNVISALEADDYESLPSAVFVRGYLRNYAKLLEIPIESVIEGYEYQLGHQLPSAIVPAGESPAQSPQRQATSNHFWVKAMTFTIITVLMILLSVTIVSQNFLSKQTDTTTTTVQIPLQSPSNSDGLHEESEAPPFTPLPSSTPATNGTQPSGTEVPVVVPIGTPGHSTAPENTTTPATEETVTIYLKQRSWLEITDSTNKKIYDKIASANSDFSVKGIPPFRIKAGNIDGVSIEYKGEKNLISNYNKQPNSTRTYLVGDGTTTVQP